MFSCIYVSSDPVLTMIIGAKLICKVRMAAQYFKNEPPLEVDSLYPSILIQLPVIDNNNWV